MSDGGHRKPPNEPMGFGSARDELRRIGSLIVDARRNIGAGRAIDVVGLESVVRAVCTKAQNLPADEGRELRPHLEAVLYDLDALSTELTERFGDVARREGMAAPGNADANRGKG
jgi:hypothetical protein